MRSGPCIATVALVLMVAAPVARSAPGPEPGLPGAAPRGCPAPAAWLDDALTGPPLPLAAEPADPLTDRPARLALPPGHPRDGLPAEVAAVTLPAAPLGMAQPQQWRVDNGRPALRVNLQPGSTHGFANRFDPSDLHDDGLGPPRPVRIRKIHFLVNESGEPTGPMEWHVWEDNGGHKADVGRDIVPPFTVTGRPGANVIDLEALGLDVTVAPPRMFHVGVANKPSEEVSPDVMLDDGLPFVGGSGDFHASVSGTAIGANPNNMYCGVHEWVLLSAQLQGEDTPRSPVWMIWLEVAWGPPPEQLLFEQIAGPGQPAGAFEGGSRIAWGDYDGDGLEDLLVNGSRLFRNLGDGAFEDVTATAGITDTGNGGLWADYNNDGHLDFYQYTPNCVPCQDPAPDNYDDLWRNNGDGTFTNVRDVDYGGDPDAPVPRDPYPTEAAVWADFNGDGYLDLYVANHVDWASGACFDDFLWLNEGPPDYGFRDVSEASGIRAVKLCGRGVSAADFDSDGDIDVFVSNYRLNPDLLWVNTGNGPDGVPRFRNEARARGVEGVAKSGQFANAFGHTIGAVWGDLDRDGDQDLVAARLAHSAWLCFSDPTMVYLSSGWADGYRFTDARAASGVAYVETHSDPSLVDVDNDGWLDLHLTHVYDGWRASLYRNATGDALPVEPKVAYLPAVLRRAALGSVPQGPGAAAGALLRAQEEAAEVRFQNVTHLSGIYPRTGWGSGWADFDNDGDLDLAARGLWRNLAADQPDANRWLQVRAVGCGNSNRDAIGARVGVRAVDTVDGTEHELWSEVVGGRGTGSQDSRLRHFGLGAGGTVTLVRVLFPSGAEQLVSDAGHDRRLTVTEVGAYIRPSSWQVPFGEEVTLAADTCGVERQVEWDLDDDGVFDDASGAVVQWRPAASGLVPVAAAVTDGASRSVSRVTIEVLVPPAALR